MPKPRYDDEANESRHAAASEEECLEMERKYSWELKGVEPTGNSVLPADCVFDGYCPFPSSRMDLTQGDTKENKDA